MLEASLTRMESYVLLGDEPNIIRMWLGGIFHHLFFSHGMQYFRKYLFMLIFLNVYWRVVFIVKIWTWHKHCCLLPPFLSWFQLQVKRFIQEINANIKYTTYNLYTR